jgi:hypothetical protein
MKNEKPKIKAVVVKDTITLMLVGNKNKIILNRAKNPELFESILQLIKDKNHAELEKQFGTLQQRLDSFTGGSIETKDGKMFLVGSKEPIPVALSKAILEAQKNRADFMPLLKFWEKLLKNPSKNSREQLFAYMIANKICLTQDGDLVLEKGVSRKRGSNVADNEFVDTHKGTVQYKIGSTVEMDRKHCNDDPRATCSTGLHVAPPAYVRSSYSSNILIECIVSPTDVVSVPYDYSARKIRVCRLHVAGFAGVTPRSEMVALSFTKEAPDHVLSNKNESYKNPSDLEKATEKARVIEKKSATTDSPAAQIAGLTAKQMVDFIQQKTGILIEISLKNKTAIQKKAVEILNDHVQKQPAAPEKIEVETIVSDEFDSMTAKAIVDFIQQKYNFPITITLKNKKAIIKEARRIVEVRSKVADITQAIEKQAEEVPVVTEQKADIDIDDSASDSVDETEETKAEEVVPTIELYNDDIKDKFKKTEEIIEQAIIEQNSSSGTITLDDKKDEKEVIDLSSLDKHAIVALVKQRFNMKISTFLRTEKSVRKEAEEIFKSKGYAVV